MATAFLGSEKAIELLKEFMECGQEPKNIPRSVEIVSELQTLGYTIWISENEYSIVPTDLSLKLLLGKHDKTVWEETDEQRGS